MTVTLASLALGPRTGSGDYILGTHPTQTSGILASRELRIAPGGRIMRLFLRVAFTDRRGVGATDPGIEVIRPDANKVLLRFQPPGGSREERTFSVDVLGGREVVLRPVSESRDAVIVRGRSWVEYIADPPDTTGAARR